MSHEQRRRAARSAVAQRDWRAAREGFRTAGTESTEDLAALAVACWWLGHVEEYVEASARLHEQYLRDGEVARAAMTAFELGYTELVRGQEGAGTGWMARARRLFEEVPDAPERGYAFAVDAKWAVTIGELDRAADLAAQVLQLAELHREPTLQALGLFLAGLTALGQGRTPEGLRNLDEAMVPMQAGEVAPMWAGLLYCDTIRICHDLLDLPRAQHWTAVTEQWCEGYAPAVLFTGICRVHRAQLLHAHGQWSRAEQEARRAAADLEDLDVEVAAEAHYSFGEVCRLRGDLDAAEAAYRRAHELGRDPLPGLALLRLRRGRTQVAASILDAALAAEEAPLERAPLLAARIEVHLAGADPQQAEPILEELDRIAEETASPGWRAESLRWHGATALARDDPAEAVRTLRRARTLWQRMGAPYPVCRIRLDLAAAYEALDDDDTAGRERAQATADLDRLGAHEPMPGRPDLAGLTAREAEVVAMVASGCTNRQAARSLHIHESTIARHLANVYLKAGVTSRTGAVAWARDRGLV